MEARIVLIPPKAPQLNRRTSTRFFLITFPHFGHSTGKSLPAMGYGFLFGARPVIFYREQSYWSLYCRGKCQVQCAV